MRISLPSQTINACEHSNIVYRELNTPTHRYLPFTYIEQFENLTMSDQNITCFTNYPMLTPDQNYISPHQ